MEVWHQDSAGQYNNGFSLGHDILRFVIFRRRSKSFNRSYADQINAQALGFVQVPTYYLNFSPCNSAVQTWLGISDDFLA